MARIHVIEVNDDELSYITAALENYREDMKDDDFDEIDLEDLRLVSALYLKFKRLDDES